MSEPIIPTTPTPQRSWSHLLRQVWQFLIQPTDGDLRPTILSTTTSGTEGALVTNATTIAGPTTIATRQRDWSTLVEYAGLIGAVLIYQLVRLLWQRYRRGFFIEAKPAAVVELTPSQRRIQELTRTLQLMAHPEGGFYRRIFQSPWMLRDETTIEHEQGGYHPRRRLVENSAANDTSSTSSTVVPFHFPRPITTSIYFLLTEEHPISHLHRLPADEQWCHIEGDPLLIVQVDPQTGEYSERLLGPIRSTENSTHASASASIHTTFLRPCSTAPSNTTSSLSELSTSAIQSIAHPTHVVPGGVWFGARCCDPNRFESLSTTAEISSSSSASSVSSSSTLSSTTSSSAAAIPSTASTFFSTFGSFVSDMFFQFPGLEPDSVEDNNASNDDLRPRYGYTLVCCTVAPGFQFEDFTLMDEAKYRELQIESNLRRRMTNHSDHVTAGATCAAVSFDLESMDVKLSEVHALVLHGEERRSEMASEAIRTTNSTTTMMTDQGHRR